MKYFTAAVLLVLSLQLVARLAGSKSVEQWANLSGGSRAG